MLERFRRTGIRVDRSGRFWHEGEQISHAGLRNALLRWLDRLADGRHILRLDARRYAYIEVDDSPLLVLSARWAGDRVFVTVNDGSEEELAYDTLVIAPDNALYCSVRGGRLEARLMTPAFYALAEGMEEVGDGFALQAGGERHPIRSRPTGHPSQPIPTSPTSQTAAASG